MKIVELNYLKHNFGKGMLFNVAFALYALIFQGLITDAINAGTTSHKTHIPLAVLFFVVSMAEAFAYTYKIRIIAGRILPRKISPNESAVFGMPLLFRLLLGIMSAVAISILLTPSLLERSAASIVALIMAFLLLIKELYVLLAFFFLVRKPRVSEKKKIPEFAWDFILFVHTCLSCTVFLLPGMFFKMTASSDVLTIFMYGIFIFLGFIALRVTILLEEYLVIKSKRDAVLAIAGMLFAVACATFTLIK